MTAISTIRRQQISRCNLQHLLGDEGPAYEALGSGVQQALDCLTEAREFYELPQGLQPFLDRYALQLRLALTVLDEAKQALQ